MATGKGPNGSGPNEVAPTLLDRLMGRQGGIGPNRGREQTTTDRKPIGGQHEMRTADQDAVMQDFARVVTPGGFTGPRGKYDPAYPGLKETQAAGVPPVLAPYEPYKVLPKDTAIPQVPHQVERYGDVLTTANSGRLLDRSAAFPWHTLQIDNYSRIWLYVPAANRYIPPFVWGVQFPIYAAANKVEIDAAAPPNYTQPAANAADVFSVTCYEAMKEYSPGIPIQNQGGAPSGTPGSATIVAGAQTPGDAVANPTDAVDTRDFMEVWSSTDSDWDRMVSASADALAATLGIAAAGNMVWNGATWDRLYGTPAADGRARTGIAGVGAMAFNGVTWDRPYNASAANMTLSPVKGVQLVAPPGGFSDTSTAAAGQASASQAAGGAGVRHVCTSISASFAAGVTAGGATQVNLRDGATGAGTILWSAVLDAPTAGNDSVNISGLAIVGSAATAMTLEFAAAGAATTVQNVSFTGYDVV